MPQVVSDALGAMKAKQLASAIVFELIRFEIGLTRLKQQFDLCVACIINK